MAAELDFAALTERWHARWPGCRPIAHELRVCAFERWVRFHSLPGSKRYPDSAEEMQEVLRRHHVVLDELRACGEPTGLIVLSCRWRGEGEVHPFDDKVEELLHRPPTWWSVEDWPAGDEDHEHATDVQAVLVEDPEVVDGLLRLAAEDEAGGLIFAPVTLDWLYCPYDGGADVLLATPDARDALRQRHRDWLSQHPSGL